MSTSRANGYKRLRLSKPGKCIAIVMMNIGAKVGSTLELIWFVPNEKGQLSDKGAAGAVGASGRAPPIIAKGGAAGRKKGGVAPAPSHRIAWSCCSPGLFWQSGTPV